MRSLLIAFLFGCLALAGGCHRGEVRLPASKQGGRAEWRDPIPPGRAREICEPLYYKVAAPASFAEALRQPPPDFVLGSKLRWNSVARGLQERLEFLFQRHNLGRISAMDFDRSEAEGLESVALMGTWKEELDVLLDEFDAACSAMEALAEQPGPRPGEPRLASAMGKAVEDVDSLMQDAKRHLTGMEMPAPPQQEALAGRSATPPGLRRSEDAPRAARLRFQQAGFHAP